MGAAGQIGRECVAAVSRAAHHGWSATILWLSRESPLRRFRWPMAVKRLRRWKNVGTTERVVGTALP